MTNGYFYYIDDKYFSDFPDSKLMKNKETLNGQPHNRPCFYAFKDKSTGLYWMIPISSRVNKYQVFYNQIKQRYNRCDTIMFGEILGHRKAFLIQNMCPTTEEYIKNKYIDAKTNTPVQVNGAFEKDLIRKAKKVLALQRKGKHLIFPDVLNIERQLLTK